MRTHTGQKPFQCDYPNCEKRFSQSSNLASHKKSHWEEEEKLRKLKLKEIKKINAIKNWYENLYEILDKSKGRKVEIFEIRNFALDGFPQRMHIGQESVDIQE